MVFFFFFSAVLSCPGWGNVSGLLFPFWVRGLVLVLFVWFVLLLLFLFLHSKALNCYIVEPVTSVIFLPWPPSLDSFPPTPQAADKRLILFAPAWCFKVGLSHGGLKTTEQDRAYGRRGTHINRKIILLVQLIETCSRGSFHSILYQLTTCRSVCSVLFFVIVLGIYLFIFLR